MSLSRRTFLKLSSLITSGLLPATSGLVYPGTVPATSGLVYPGTIPAAGALASADNELLRISDDLVKQWGAALVTYQVRDPRLKGLHGGILCPGCAAIHGRCGDAIFPLLYLAEKTGEEKYSAAALELYGWMENSVSRTDGSWVNEVNLSSWKGITVFTTIMLTETLQHFGHLLDPPTKAKWRERTENAAAYLYREIDIHTGNINYPVTCSYALSLAGNYFNREDFRRKGRDLAHQSLGYFTKTDGLLYGEGHPEKTVSPYGCYSIDLGYNVEESLPALVLYAKLTGDTQVLDTVQRAMKTHMEFMLPDGGWDNSWGTRNFKWTYWGSRTSDGCQLGYALLADREPVFYTVALQNTKLLQACTSDNLLYGGPGYRSHGVLPCVSHIFGHGKALAMLLVRAAEVKSGDTVLPLPRAQAYGVRAFADIRAWLIAKGSWRGTVTGYDQEYSMKSGHATGGALTMLWHERVGPLIVASMTTYQLVEPFNMQADKDGVPMCLTPRFEHIADGITYTNIHDLGAEIQYSETGDEVRFDTRSRLLDASQGDGGPDLRTTCAVSYSFKETEFVLHAQCTPGGNPGAVNYILPVIAAGSEPVTVESPCRLQIQKAKGVVRIETSSPFVLGETGPHGRSFNFVPGMEAIPLLFGAQDIRMTITVT